MTAARRPQTTTSAGPTKTEARGGGLDLGLVLLEAAVIAVSLGCSAVLTVAIPAVERRLASYGSELPWLTRACLALFPVHCGMLMASLMAGALWCMEWTGSDAGMVQRLRGLSGDWLAHAPGLGWLTRRREAVLLGVILAWFVVAVLSAFSFVVLPSEACCRLDP
ncbi:MAG: hypothetical protein HY924_07590 [Elusimicrobia bacterium]|nr:hypothetical protein [Elusimicrobiota bacterium]